MKIRITQTCGIAGKHTEAGEVVDLPENEAIAIINMGKATPDDGKAKPKDRAVGLNTDNAAPLKKRTRKK